MDRNEILKELQKGNSNLQLPAEMDFNIDEDKVLTIGMKKKGLTGNMQDDSAAFESWAICLKAWFPEFIDKVVINGEFPEDKNNQHYKRFLYRLKKFTETYSWTETTHEYMTEIEEVFPKENSNLYINVPKQEASEEATHCEAQLERAYCDKIKSSYKAMNHQLPTRIFNNVAIKEKNAVTPGGFIDIWGITNDDILRIFELKLPTNTKIGIISELMFYVNVMIDVLRHEINIPQEGKSFRNIPQKRKFFRSFGEIYKLYEKQSACKKIEGVFLADNFHPMIQEKQEIENATNLRIEKVLQSPIDKDGGYITFEFTCKNKLLLRERTDSRGANCTSIDTLVYDQTTDGRKILIPIEWKYTERYEKKKVDDKAVQNRHQTVKDRYLGLVDEESNLKEWPEEFYWDPLYEFARQTLLVEQIIAQKPTCGTTTIEADDYVHLIVRPNENKDIISDIQRFRNEMCLKNLNKVIDIDPQKLLSPLEGNTNYKELLDYLETRYWQSK